MISIQKLLITSLFKRLIKIGLICITVYLIVLLIFYIFQDRLIFYPQVVSEAVIKQITEKEKNIEELSLEMKDGISLQGWYVKTTSKKPQNLIFYFGGNAEEITYLTYEMKELTGWNSVLLNYRGYGKSEGKPSEKQIYKDALEIYDYFLQKLKYSPKKIIIMGRSIGSGVATYLASKKKHDGVILVTPYDNLTSVAQEKYPFLPVKLILKHSFDSLSIVENIKTPLLILIASEDEVIPPWHAEKLASKWGGRVEKLVFKGEGHNTISSNSKYYPRILDFLEAVSKEKQLKVSIN